MSASEDGSDSTTAVLSSEEVTQLLDAWSGGDPMALDQLLPVVYDQLREIAKREFRRERRDHTLQPTAAVHEAFIRFKGERKVHWKSRTQFFAATAKKIRRLLIDHARAKKREKRGGGIRPLPLDEALEGRATVDQWLSFDDAFQELRRLDRRQSQVAELRIFAGLKYEEISEALDISRSTVVRDWDRAKLWLRRAMSKS